MFIHFHLCFHCHQSHTTTKKKNKRKEMNNSIKCKILNFYSKFNQSEKTAAIHIVLIHVVLLYYLFLLHFPSNFNFRESNLKLWTCFVCLVFIFCESYQWTANQSHFNGSHSGYHSTQKKRNKLISLNRSKILICIAIIHASSHIHHHHYHQLIVLP